MSTFLRKLSILLSFLIVGMFLVTAWFFPILGRTLGIVVVVLGLTVNSYVLIKKHKEEYQQGKISRTAFVRRIIVEMMGILLAMLLAALIASRVSHIVTRQILDLFTRFIAGVFVAFLVGISVGFVFKKMWDGVQKRTLG
jgi:hypothetical protein